MTSDKNIPIEQSEIVEFAGQLIQKKSKIHLNLDQEFILTTEDKVLLCLTKHLSRMGKKNAWITPLGILLTILVVFPTTTFQSFFLSAETWEAFFIISGLLSFIWLIISIKQSRVSTSINEVVAEIKKTAIKPEKPTTFYVPSSSIVKAFGSDDLVIISATYGANDSLTDVSGIIKSKIKDGKVKFTVNNDNLGGDPIRGVQKKLEVKYSYEDRIQNLIVDEDNMLILP